MPTTVIRYRDRARTVKQLGEGDKFTLDVEHTDGTWKAKDDATWYVCYSNGWFMGTISVDADDERPEAGCIRISVESGEQPCVVRDQVVRIRVGGTVEVSVAGWAREYGLDQDPRMVAYDARDYEAFKLERLIPEHLRDGIVYVPGKDEK
jgi:hypothetical protein